MSDRSTLSLSLCELFCVSSWNFFFRPSIPTYIYIFFRKTSIFFYCFLKISLLSERHICKVKAGPQVLSYRSTLSLCLWEIFFCVSNWISFFALLYLHLFLFVFLGKRRILVIAFSQTPCFLHCFYIVLLSPYYLSCVKLIFFSVN
jgi:hypothetical protein